MTDFKRGIYSPHKADHDFCSPYLTMNKTLEWILDRLLDCIGRVPDKCQGCGSRTPPWTLPDGTPCEEDCFFKNH